MLMQHPNAFEFNEDFLMFIADHINSGWFADFMFNSEQERVFFQSRHGYISIWMPILTSQHLYMNPSYRQQQGILLPVVRGMRIVLWTRLFSRWHDEVWRAAWLQDCSHDVKTDTTSAAEGETRNMSYSVSNSKPTSTVSNCTRCQILFTSGVKRVECKRCCQVFCDKCAKDSRNIPAVSTWFASRVCLDCCIELDNESKGSNRSNDSSYSKMVGALTGLRVNTSLSQTGLKYITLFCSLSL
jgi:hypothetical protein